MRRPARDLVVDISGLVRRLCGQYPAALRPHESAHPWAYCGRWRLRRTARNPASRSTSSHLRPSTSPLAQSEGEGNGPACGVAALVSGLEQPLYLLDAVGLHLVLPRFRRLGQLNGVLAEMASPHGLIKGGAQGSVHLVSALPCPPPDSHPAASSFSSALVTVGRETSNLAHSAEALGKVAPTSRPSSAKTSVSRSARERRSVRCPSLTTRQRPPGTGSAAPSFWSTANARRTTPRETP